MKKHFSKILLISLSLVLLFALVACDPTDTPPKDPNEDPGYETAIFDVTFNSDGDTSFSNYNTKAKYGEKISAPMYDGKPAIPVKKGHTFKYWSIIKENKDIEFNFAVDAIKDVTVLKAFYEPNTYTHIAYLYEEKDKDTFKDKVSIADNTTYTSVYGASGKMLAPKFKNTEGGNQNYFVYWYCYPDNDTTKAAIRFSDLATLVANDREEYATVAETTMFIGVKPLTLYAMWFTNLPTYEVSYNTGDGGSKVESKNYKIIESVLKPSAPTREGYDFDSWYYIVKSEDEEMPDKHVPFVFDDPNDEKDNPTILEKDTVLHAKWTKSISISSAADLSSKIYNLIYKETPSDEEKTAIEELCNANIHLTANITLGTSFKPLFTKEHPFKGTFDAGIYDGEGVQTDKYGISGTTNIATISGDTYVSLFGVSSGTIKNLSLKNITLSLDISGSTPARTAYIGAIASINNGAIFNCDVTELTLNITSPNEVTIGGIAALNSNGDINECSVNFKTLTVNAEGITLGGIVGKNESSTILKCIVNGKMVVTATNDKNGANGIAFANVGGLVGMMSSGTCNQSNFDKVDIKCNTKSSSDTNVGGAVGKLQNAILRECFGAVTLTLTTDTSANTGGLVGYINQSLAKDSYAISTITATATSGTLSVGGLAGSVSGSGSTAELLNSYSTGSVTAHASSTASVNVGGLVGYSYSSKSDSKSKIDSCFTTVNVVATTTDNASANLGIFVGYDKGVSTFSRLFFVEAKLKLNGVQYGASDTAPTFPVTELGIVKDTTSGKITNITTDDNLKSKDWIKGNMNLDHTNIWEVVDGAYPALKWSIPPVIVPEPTV